MAEAEAEQVSPFKDEGETVRVPDEIAPAAPRSGKVSRPFHSAQGAGRKLDHQNLAFLPAAYPFLCCLSKFVDHTSSAF
jgi:hypothetical protein